MEHIAPAVMNGGFSTMLALSLLVSSQSHIFISFFKIFFMICIFGLFHGLILLPVVLCLLGPIENEDEKEMRKNAVALANAKESQHYQPAMHQQVKLVDQQLKPSDEPVKSEMQLKTFNNGDLVEKLKLAEKQEPAEQLNSAEPREQLKSAEQLNSAEQQDQLKPVDDELIPAETASDQLSVETQAARNDDVKIHVKQNAPPDKMEVKEEEMKINIEAAGDEDEEAMEALLSHDMRETEIRWDFKSEIEIDSCSKAIYSTKIEVVLWVQIKMNTIHPVIWFKNKWLLNLFGQLMNAVFTINDVREITTIYIVRLVLILK